MNDNNLLKDNRLDNINISKLSPKNLIISKKRTIIIIIILSIPRSPKKNNNNQHLKSNNKVDGGKIIIKSRIQPLNSKNNSNNKNYYKINEPRRHLIVKISITQQK